MDLLLYIISVPCPTYIIWIPCVEFAIDIYYARSERSERSAQLLAFKRENFVCSRTKNSHFSMFPFRGCGFTYGKKSLLHVSVLRYFKIVEIIGSNTREITGSNTREIGLSSIGMGIRGHNRNYEILWKKIKFYEKQLNFMRNN